MSGKREGLARKGTSPASRAKSKPPLPDLGNRPLHLLRAIRVTGEHHLLAATRLRAAEINTFLESHPRLFGAQAPVGYFAFPSSTYNVFLFFRTLMTQGENGPDPAAGAVNAERTRVYPLFEVLRLVRRLPVDEAAEPPAARRGIPPDLLLLSAATRMSR